MKVETDFYEILGVRSDAESEVITAAYRALAKKYHPDTFKGPANEAKARMSALNSAYDVLSKPESRMKYDRLRRESKVEPPKTNQPSGNPNSPPTPNATKEPPKSNQAYERRIIEPEPEGFFAANRFLFLGFGILAFIILYTMK